MAKKINERRLFEAILRQDLCAFTIKVAQTLIPDRTYAHNWHVECVAHALLEVYHGIVRRLIINQPPRTLKSICASVALVAWSIGHDPSKKFACISYSDVLTGDLARYFRLVVTSDWYRALFPNVEFCKITETECETTSGGGRFSVSVGGSITGRGADFLVIDDPLKASDAQSEKLRRTANQWYAETLPSRLNDKQTGAVILVMQRLHEDDLAGKLLREGGWKHLNLPAIAEQDEDIPIGQNAVHHRKVGDVLHPEREPLWVLEKLKREMGSIAFSAQYQQMPLPLAGNIVRREWIRYYPIAPARTPATQVVQSWDIASTTGQNNDYSACTTWFVQKRNYYLLDVWRGRLQFPDLKRKLNALAREHRADSILIEKAGPGLLLFQEIRTNSEANVPIPIGIIPQGSKIARMEAQSVRFEAGQVFLPEEAPWLANYLHEILGFPNSRFDDQVDSTSQLLNWAEKTHRWDHAALESYTGRPLVQYLPNGIVIG
jgi:predicted phage terminase large subunit-like protein